MYSLLYLFLCLYCRRRNLHVLTHSFPTRRSSYLIPSKCAVSVCSIFIASSVSSLCPLVTASPADTSTAMILPGIGDRIAPSPATLPAAPTARHGDNCQRSEERRVGKECVSTCRSRWSPYP